ncbi:MAG: ABC transporter substrate-binding protein [Sporomusaceae bacterium]|nr:ABC transporter substrate-binding protein [Sporomusaceae bacterium]
MKKPWYLIVSLIVIAAMSLALVAGCGGGDKKPAETPKAAGPKGTVMIYTSIYPDIIELIKPALKKQFPDLEVQWFQAGTEKVMAKVAGEIEAKKIQADLLMVADPSYYLTLKNQNLLLKYDSPNRKDVQINKDAEGYWTGVRISNMIIAYNTAKVNAADVPKTWKDLLDPKWKGKIAMPSPLLSGTAYVAAGELSEKYGWKYFEDLKANGMKVEEGNSAIQNKLVRGEYLAVMILEENILKIGAKGEPVKVVYPEDGTIVIPSPIAIFNTSKNQEAAKVVLDWFLSKEGQEVIVKGWMHSVRGDVAAPTGAPALKTFMDKAIKPNWEKLSKENEKVKETFRSKVLEK